MKALEIKNLHKSFKSDFFIKKFHILKGINLSVEKGEIYGFLGPNGAGKTTTMKCVLGIIFPDSGEITISGLSYKDSGSRGNLGFLPEHPYFYDYLTPRELLAFTGKLFSMSGAEIRERSTKLLKLVGLGEKGNVKLRKFSKGMIQRVGLAQSLIHDPELLILDEPFSGLDPIGRKELRDIILSLKEGGKTIFFSSHILQDMEMMVDRVGIILGGEIRREGQLTDLISHSVRFYEVVFSGVQPDKIPELGFPAVQRNNEYLIKLEDHDQVDRVLPVILNNNGSVVSVTPVKRTLEDIFLEEIQSDNGANKEV